MAHDPSGSQESRDGKLVSLFVEENTQGMVQEAIDVRNSFHDILRQTGWLLRERSQKLREGHNVSESIPNLYPLVGACKQFMHLAEDLRDQLLLAQTLLEYKLGKTPGSQAPTQPIDAGVTANAGVASGVLDYSLAQLDPELYQAISSIPLDWEGSGRSTTNATLASLPAMTPTTTLLAPASQPDASIPLTLPGSDANSAINIDSDDDEPKSVPKSSRRGSHSDKDQQASKRRKIENVADNATGTTDIMSLFSDQLRTADQSKGPASSNSADFQKFVSDTTSSVSDLNWLDFESLNQQDAQDPSRFSRLFGTDVNPNLQGLSSLDFSTDTRRSTEKE
ncbi:hypothetical protein MYAM1_000561 [Malassezia yamatoensis]|uniref:Uncharacterized protein n=1 Tax=Malassezia yamatoensis TaxID=253288 RepID=A0AAJ6CHH6_9BASI|nr:hypothetical protein MYAM1_000561 [Malassezia yamatoensis]